MTFKTDRLNIREFSNKDFDLWKEGYANRLPPQNEFDVGTVEDLNKRYYNAFVTALTSYSSEDKIYCFGVFDAQTSKFIGVLEIIVLLRNDINWGSIGISVHNQFWGMGYGTEIANCGTLIAKDVLKLRRLECAIELNNDRSTSIFKKIGYDFECVRKNFSLNGNGYADMEIYSKVLVK